MRVTLSARVEAELERQFEYGVERFGHDVAERTFGRVRHMIFDVIPAQPEAAEYHVDRDIFERAIPQTPFVVFYRYDERAQAINVNGFYRHSWDRDSFEG